jgi:hypothetical protein
MKMSITTALDRIRNNRLQWIEIYSEKVGSKIKVTINPVLTKEERLKRIIGLSNSVTTG